MTVCCWTANFLGGGAIEQL